MGGTLLGGVGLLILLIACHRSIGDTLGIITVAGIGDVNLPVKDRERGCHQRVRIPVAIHIDLVGFPSTRLLVVDHSVRHRIKRIAIPQVGHETGLFLRIIIIEPQTEIIGKRRLQVGVTILDVQRILLADDVLEILDIISWVSIWEATSIIVIQTYEMRQIKKSFLKLLEAEITISEQVT